MITPYDKNFKIKRFTITDIIGNSYVNLGSIDINTVDVYFDRRNNLTKNQYGLYLDDNDNTILRWAIFDMRMNDLGRIMSDGGYEYLYVSYIKL